LRFVTFAVLLPNFETHVWISPSCRAVTLFRSLIANKALRVLETPPPLLSGCGESRSIAEFPSRCRASFSYELAITLSLFLFPLSLPHSSLVISPKGASPIPSSFFLASYNIPCPLPHQVQKSPPPSSVHSSHAPFPSMNTGLFSFPTYRAVLRLRFFSPLGMRKIVWNQCPLGYSKVSEFSCLNTLLEFSF